MVTGLRLNAMPIVVKIVPGESFTVRVNPRIATASPRIFAKPTLTLSAGLGHHQRGN